MARNTGSAIGEGLAVPPGAGLALWPVEADGVVGSILAGPSDGETADGVGVRAYCTLPQATSETERTTANAQWNGVV
jgi:hypothetical protein